MADLISAMSGVSGASSASGLMANLAAASASSSVGGGFGGDWVVDILGAAFSADDTYSSLGDSLPYYNSVEGKARAAKLEEATTLLTGGDSAGARAIAEVLIAENPHDSIAIYVLGRSHLADGDYTNAVKQFEKAAAGAPASKDIAADLKAARTLERGLDVATDEARRLLKNHSTATDGLRLATYVFDARPEEVELRISVADYYESRGRLDGACAAFIDAIDHTPVERLSPLLSRLERFAEDHSQDPAAYDLLARAYGRAGRLDDAETAFNTAMHLSENDTIFQQGLKKDFAKVYSQMGDAARASGDENAARMHYTRALELSTNDETRGDLADLEYAVGKRALAAGQNVLAMQHFTKAAAYIPVEGADELKENLGTVFDKLATKFEASGDLKRVIAARNGAFILDTKNDTRRRGLADANDVYGLSLHAQGNYHQASRYFRDALKLYPGDANYTAHLAAAQAML